MHPRNNSDWNVEVSKQVIILFLEELQRFCKTLSQKSKCSLPPFDYSSRITSFRYLWSRSRGFATPAFRHNIYLHNLFVEPDSIVDSTGHVRECNPAWYRNNPAQTHPLVPWLNRELNALMAVESHLVPKVIELILELIQLFDIQSQEFHKQIVPYTGTKTNHFQHEFYNFARSTYDIMGYDRHAKYTETPPISLTQAGYNSDSDISIISLGDETGRHFQPQYLSGDRPTGSLKNQSHRLRKSHRPKTRNKKNKVSSDDTKYTETSPISLTQDRYNSDSEINTGSLGDETGRHFQPQYLSADSPNDSFDNKDYRHTKSQTPKTRNKRNKVSSDDASTSHSIPTPVLLKQKNNDSSVSIKDQFTTKEKGETTNIRERKSNVSVKSLVVKVHSNSETINYTTRTVSKKGKDNLPPNDLRIKLDKRKNNKPKF